MIKREELFQIGRFAKPHGVKGEISLLTDFGLEDFLDDDPFVVCDMDGILVPFFIDSFRPKSRAATLVKLSGIDSEEAARTFSGKAAFALSKNIPDEYKEPAEWERLAGFAVADAKNGFIGRVSAIDDNTMNTLLRVDCDGKELLIPAALVASVSQEEKAIEVSLPDGFLEINQAK